MRHAVQQLASRTRGRILAGDPDSVATGVSIDSRTIRPGDAFFAVRGEVHDGNRFAAQAALSGAACVVVDDESVVAGLPPGTPVVLVENALRALQDLAASARAEGGAAACGITGSVGKTTTKELARLLLSGERKTHATPGNLNNHYGLPLAILGAPEDAEMLVLEMGISTPGEMDRLVEIARPDIGLVTVIAPVHTENFGTFADLCEEKMKLARGSRRALLNADDPEQVARASSVAGAVSWYGEGEGAASGIRLVSVVSRGLLGSRVVLEEAGQRHEIELPLAGRHQARNLLAASALARAAGVSWEAIARQARLAEPARHRGQIVSAGGATFVDDSYNANPLAMRAALALLVQAEPASRRILVAGDMLELGEISVAEHRALGAHAVALVDVLVAVGPLAGRVAEGARSAGREAVVLSDAAEAGGWLRDNVRAGDVVLVKGSRGIGLDRALDAFVAAHAAGAAS